MKLSDVNNHVALKMRTQQRQIVVWASQSHAFPDHRICYHLHETLRPLSVCSKFSMSQQAHTHEAFDLGRIAKRPVAAATDPVVIRSYGLRAAFIA